MPHSPIADPKQRLVPSRTETPTIEQRPGLSLLRSVLRDTRHGMRQGAVRIGQGISVLTVVAGGLYSEISVLDVMSHAPHPKSALEVAAGSFIVLSSTATALAGAVLGSKAIIEAGNRLVHRMATRPNPRGDLKETKSGVIRFDRHGRLQAGRSRSPHHQP